VGRFAAEVAARHETGSPGRRMPLSLVFARPWRFQTLIQRYWQTFSLRRAPQFHLRLQTLRRASEEPDSGVAMPPPSRNVEPVTSAHALASGFVEYVHARARRIDATFGSAAALVNPPVPRVVRRLAPVASAVRGDAVSSEASTRSAPRIDVSSAARVAAAAPAAIDVERLTEQVIKGIDRRIIAQRERFGRP
jgi:hypothetical protein